MFFAHDFVGVCALRMKALVEPQKCGCCGRIFIAQSLDQLDRKGSRERKIGKRSQRHGSKIRRSDTCTEQMLSQCVGGVTR